MRPSLTLKTPTPTQHSPEAIASGDFLARPPWSQVRPTGLPDSPLRESAGYDDRLRHHPGVLHRGGSRLHQLEQENQLLKHLLASAWTRSGA